MIVYRITNKINNKIYIGQTVSTLQERWNSHCCHSKHGRNAVLGKAIRKYGRSNFTIEQIDSAQSLEELNKKEIEYISLHKSTDKSVGYNLMTGGDNSRHSEATRQKMSKSKLGKPSNRKGTTSSLETRRKQSEALKGIPRSKEIIEKISKSQKGKFVSEETRCKISKARKGKTPWNKGLNVPKDNVVSLEDFKLVKEAGESLEAIRTMIDDAVYSGMPGEDLNKFLDAVLNELEPLVKDLEPQNVTEPKQS